MAAAAAAAVRSTSTVQHTKGIKARRRLFHASTSRSVMISQGIVSETTETSYEAAAGMITSVHHR